MHQYQDLIALFNACFTIKYNTILIKGEDEPLYLPANGHQPHNLLYFAHGYFSSALHECSHWLIAGEERRKLIDFGYWYEPDGRSLAQQQLFQQVEVKPQALEWIFSMAANYRFRLSIDNLNGEETELDGFKNSVFKQVQIYCAEGLSLRATIFREALCSFYGSRELLDIHDFDRELLL
ncbi:MAG: elongation factor P hydroxylase [Tatlockia sp.]|nr:elongation factor P hydroxylase [Tatlockia sp.]